MLQGVQKPNARASALLYQPSQADKEVGAEMLRIFHIYQSAMQTAMLQLEILDHEFNAIYDHSPIHHMESRLKSIESIAEKLRRKGYAINADNLHRICDIAGIRVICNYVDDIYYLRNLMVDHSGFNLMKERDYIHAPKENGYRSLHLIMSVPFMVAEGRMELPVEIQLRTIAMDMWASLEHELCYKSSRIFSGAEEGELRACSDTLAQVDERMRRLFRGEINEPDDKGGYSHD